MQGREEKGKENMRSEEIGEEERCTEKRGE